MDPYLEAEQVWAFFRKRFIEAICRVISVQIPSHYPRLARRRYQAHEAIQEEYIELRKSAQEPPTTVIDIVSPTDKTTDSACKAFLEAREETIVHGINWVEIDLLLQRQPLLESLRSELPEWDFAVTVNRHAKHHQYEVYLSTIKKRLPRIKLPLTALDRDVCLDLPTIFTMAYDEGGFASLIDYAKDPPIPLSSETHQWLDATLKLAKLRS